MARSKDIQTAVLDRTTVAVRTGSPATEESEEVTPQSFPLVPIGKQVGSVRSKI